jgi:16S rRNA processing protein RimM
VAAGSGSTSSTPTGADRLPPLSPPEAADPGSGHDADDPERVVVGHVARAHGVRGDVSVQVRSDVPERRFAVGSVLFTDHPEVPTLTVAAARPHSGRLLVTFEEVHLRDVAEALQGTLLLIDADRAGSAAEPGEPDAWWDSDLLGLVARTVDGLDLGPVTDVVHGPGGDLLVIAREGRRELLVPFVHDIVPTVDPSAGTLVVDPPPGLLEL